MNTRANSFTNTMAHVDIPQTSALCLKHWSILYENKFDGTSGNYNGTEYKIELLEQAQPYHAKYIH